MSVRTIVEATPEDYKATALALRCKEVDEFMERDLLERVTGILLETLYHTPSGVGLAAPQVGINLQIAVIDEAYRNAGGTSPIVLINPSIRFVSDDMVTTNEGCLSLPGLVGPAERSKSIEITSLDMNFETTTTVVDGFLAVIMQHETDHLNGLLYLDRMPKGGVAKKANTLANRMATKSLQALKDI